MEKHRIIFATGNAGKMREVRLILADLGFDIVSMKEAGIEADIIEDGKTFAENSEIKAKAVWEKSKDIVLADDSGLVVDCLNGEPGIYSARYMGEDTSYEEKNRNIIRRVDETKDIDRSARFICDIAAVMPDKKILHATGTMEGIISHEPMGDGGFGYDPILFIPEYNKTSAQLDISQKNLISHRGKALRQMKDILKEYMN